MRKLLIGFAILLATAVSHASSTELRGPGDAWPWGLEVPFPWRGIQGSWNAKIGDSNYYFRFVSVHSNNGINQLQVTQYSGLNCGVVANGIGYEQNRVVKAVMVGEGGSFNMTVHVFRQADLKDLKVPPNFVEIQGAKTVTVMNISSMKGPVVRETYQLTKMEADIAAFCEKN